MKKKVDISIITVNYNGIKDTVEMIRSLRSNIKSTICEIIVVDNGSREDEAIKIAEQFTDDPLLKVFRSEENLGFAGGNNLGFPLATAPYLMLLNNDTYIEEDTLHYLIERIESQPEIGVVSPKIKFADPPQNIQFAGYTPMAYVTMRQSLIGYNLEDTGQFEEAHSTPFCHGAALMFKREVLDKAGEMPAIYFLYYEELDWCAHISKAGYTLWYEPKCTVFHKESRSTGQNSPFRTFYLTRNRLLYACRNLGNIEKILSYIYQLIIATPKGVLVALIKRDRKTAKAILKGVGAFFKMKKR